MSLWGIKWPTGAAIRASYKKIVDDLKTPSTVLASTESLTTTQTSASEASTTENSVAGSLAEDLSAKQLEDILGYMESEVAVVREELEVRREMRREEEELAAEQQRLKDEQEKLDKHKSNIRKSAEEKLKGKKSKAGSQQTDEATTALRDNGRRDQRSSDWGLSLIDM